MGWATAGCNRIASLAGRHLHYAAASMDLIVTIRGVDAIMASTGENFGTGVARYDAVVACIQAQAHWIQMP